MEKPHRFLIEKVTSYAEEGAAFMRRRRMRSRPFARIGRPGGRIDSLDPSSVRGADLQAAALAALEARDAAEGVSSVGGAHR